MHVNLPPILPYSIGALLILFGLLRVKYLAAPRVPPAKSMEEAADPDASDTPVRGKEQKRHLRMGLLWVALGLFLVISTYLQLRRQA
jgi:hypothetical protein